MTRGRTAKVLVRRWTPAGTRREPDELIVEEPLEIRLDDHRLTVTMRTPGHDYELAAGFCFTEGALGGAPVVRVRYCATGSACSTEFNVVTVETGGRAPEPTPRLTTTTSSCGACGTADLDALRDRLGPLPHPVAFPYDVLAAAPEAVRAEQRLFASTGGVHAAASFGPDGTVHVVREDIGRHNAVDKVVGRLLLDRQLPARDRALFVSGRASFEIVQKAWAAGFSAIVAVSAPSSLALETARAAGLVLAGFVRPGRMNVYTPD